MNGATVFSFCLIASYSTLACEGFLPRNNFKIPASEKSMGLAQNEYDSVIDKVEKVYTSISYDKGAQLVIHRKWEDPTVNAGTYRDDDGYHWHLNLYGGFARHPKITKDGYTLVVCHEIGHHLGGAPKKYLSWSSVEGQADYFSVTKCARKIWEEEDNIQLISHMTIPPIVSEKCQSSFEEENEVALCIRTSLAGAAVANVMASNGAAIPQFETPKEEVVTETIEKHPPVQCRLDTYFKGSLCPLSHLVDFSDTDETVGSCQDTIGERPACWYKPKKEGPVKTGPKHIQL